MLVDVDYFKQFNDHYGHQVGTSACNRWRACWPRCCGGKTIWLPVTAGEEFALLLPCTTLQGAMQIAEQVRTPCEPSAFPTTNPGSRAGQLQLRVATLVPDQHHPLPSLSRKRMRPLSGQA